MNYELYHWAARKYRCLSALQARVAARPRIAAYLASPRRIALNHDGMIRRHPQLDRDRGA